jgi:hypothetical protein
MMDRRVSDVSGKVLRLAKGAEHRNDKGGGHKEREKTTLFWCLQWTKLTVFYIPDKRPIKTRST